MPFRSIAMVIRGVETIFVVSYFFFSSASPQSMSGEYAYGHEMMKLLFVFLYFFVVSPQLIDSFMDSSLPDSSILMMDRPT